MGIHRVFDALYPGFAHVSEAKNRTWGPASRQSGKPPSSENDMSSLFGALELAGGRVQKALSISSFKHPWDMYQQFA